MKTIILLFISSVFLALSCSAQTERIETKLMDCTFQSYADGGAELKTLISDYQSLLIKEGILQDNSARSYRSILEKISKKSEIEKEPSKFFIIEIRNINQPDLEKIERCQLKTFADSASYNLSKLRRFENIFSPDNPNSSRVSSVTKQILDVLTLEDFELDYYKLRTFLIFSYIDTDAGLDEQLSENSIGDNENIDLKNALRIEIDGNDLVYVDNKKVNEAGLKKKVRSYEEKNKSESIILLKADRETKYGTYIKVQNAIVYEIQNLRENFSKNKYNKNLDELSDQQLSEISKMYPQNLVEK
ncbi:Biopolymer transport protein ExbD/TolR [Maribacter arcticus]|uniref:Biopolymer transport protein ExbD/TolR n=2 Tax=Maribacter arcticus TaxID=561365 RepID=A0A1T5D007_9FLAO|nr:Biopolymer transport protein ExbD/TolR [Maribacter arcticus]|tara:strand:+ start:23 stop:928 length:906 start_codon:yes stop_codon:yes gene_type:complete